MEDREDPSRGQRNGRTTSALREACRRAYKGATVVFLVSDAERVSGTYLLLKKPHMADARRMLRGTWKPSSDGRPREVRCGAGLLRLEIAFGFTTAKAAGVVVVRDHSCGLLRTGCAPYENFVMSRKDIYG